MKILYCIPSLDHGGAERQSSFIAAELARIGHEVHVASCGGGPSLDRMLAAGVVWHRLSSTRENESRIFVGPLRSARAFVVFIRLIRLMRKLRPDVVQTVLAPMDILGGTAALLTRIPWILKECSSSIIYTTHRKYWFRFAFGRFADAVVSNSRHGHDYWRPVRRGRALHVIPNAITLPNASTTELAKENRFDFRSADKLVLYAGRIDIDKNVEALIGALGHIGNEIQFTAVICGKGPREARVRQMALELGIADRIVFAGHVDNLSELMKRADALVTFSRWEGCPNVVLEAMACGCPLVVSDIPGHREILDERAAWFASLDDPIGAAQAIKSALADRVEARKRAAAAQARAAARPKLETTAMLYERAYKNAIEAHQRSWREQGLWIERPQNEWQLPLNREES